MHHHPVSNTQVSWDQFCEFFWYYPEVHLSLDLSRSGISQSAFEALSDKRQKAFADMQDLEKGALANPDEGRMVGHYWLRKTEAAPTAELRTAIAAMQKQVHDFAKAVHQGTIAGKGGKFRHLVVGGIGGSALGPQLVSDALGSHDDPMQVYFMDNTDPDGIQRVIQKLGTELSTTLVLIISKSGSTPETRNACKELQAAFSAANLAYAKHFVAITSQGSLLDKQASAEGWLARFPMWDWVGGRTSLFSAVGLVPAALQGIDIDSFIQGAAAMDELTRKSESTNPAMKLAEAWHVLGQGRGAKDMVILPYKDRLVLFSKYLQQLVMESLGKEKDLSGEVVHQGIAVYGNKGSTDQHAYVQQLREGVPNFFATFIRVLKDSVAGTSAKPQNTAAIEVEEKVTSGDFLQGFLLGTRSALYENGRASLTLTLDELTPFALGSLIALYERAVGFYASLVNINAYHQPGVEAGKKAAARIIDLERAIFSALEKNTTDFSTKEIAEQIQAPQEVEMVFHLLEYLAENKRAGISRLEHRGPKHSRYCVKNIG